MGENGRIDVDFAVIISQAAQLEGIACEIENMSGKDLEGTLQNIALNWKGDNASSYLAKGDILKNNMLITAQSLKDIAEKMTLRAKLIYSKEQNAIRIATKRIY